MDSIKTRLLGSKSFLSNYSKSFSDSINSDYFPIIGLEAPRDRFMGLSSTSIYNYQSFNVPVFNLLGTQIKFNELVKTRSHDKLHPFIPYIIKSDEFLSHLINQQDLVISEETSGLHNASYGLISVYNSPTKFCGQNKILEQKWLDTYVNIYDTGVIFGNERLQEVFDSNIVQICLDNSIDPSTKWIVEALDLFTQAKYSEYITYVNSNIQNLEIDNYNIKRSILNKAIYSIILIKDQQNHNEIIQASHLLGADITSQWLISFFNN
jgi:hypothetical protein